MTNTGKWIVNDDFRAAHEDDPYPPEMDPFPIQASDSEMCPVHTFVRLRDCEAHRPSVEQAPLDPPQHLMSRETDIERMQSIIEHNPAYRAWRGSGQEARYLYDAGLRPSVEPPCEHEWSDCDDDEEAWCCRKCGAREEPEQRADESGWLPTQASDSKEKP